MEWVVIGMIATAALACPATMYGPHVLKCLGFRKRHAASASCMGMSRDSRQIAAFEQLRTRRNRLDDEIAAVLAAFDRSAALNRADAQPAQDA